MRDCGGTNKFQTQDAQRGHLPVVDVVNYSSNKVQFVPNLPVLETFMGCWQLSLLNVPCR